METHEGRQRFQVGAAATGSGPAGPLALLTLRTAELFPEGKLSDV